MPENNDVDKGAAEPSKKPDYASGLAAFHKEFQGELSNIIRELFVRPNDSILDMACGDGFYSALFATFLGPEGKIVGIDSNEAFLEKARFTLEKLRPVCTVLLHQEELKSLKGEYDLIWCAQSLYSLPEPVEAIRQMANALKPSGRLVILENDSVHQLLLPWSSRLELAIRQAEYRQFQQETNHPQKFYVGRHLPQLFAKAGLNPTLFKTQAIDRKAPLTPELRFFLEDYLISLAQKLKGYLDDPHLHELHALIDEKSPFWIDPYFTMTWINVLGIARKVTV